MGNHPLIEHVTNYIANYHIGDHCLLQHIADKIALGEVLIERLSKLTPSL